MTPEKLSGQLRERSANCSIEDVEKVLDTRFERIGSADEALRKLKEALLDRQQK